MRRRNPVIRGNSLLNESSNSKREKNRNGLAYVCYGVLLTSFLVAYFPWMIFVMKASLVLLLICCVYKLLHFDQWGKEVIHLRQFFTYLLYLILELIIENFLVWVVSALDLNKSKRLHPLQDNIQFLVTTLSKSQPQLRTILRTKWVHTAQFLSVSILVPLSTLWDQVCAFN
eukprot:g6661.t1